MRTRLAYTFAAMTNSALTDVDALTPAQFVDMGRTSRAIFDAAWDSEHHDRALIRHAISAVVRTFASDPAASEELLRRLLTHERLAAYGYEEIPALAHELSSLFGVAPEFCVDVYEVAFTFDETSNEKTVLSSGVLGLTSTQSQDWNGGRYSLGEDYPAFLAESPPAAIDALITVRTAYAVRRGYSALVEPTPQSVDYGDRHTSFLRDGGIHDLAIAQEDETKVLTAFESRLTDLARDDHNQALQLVELVLDKTAPAAIWRSIFRTGAEYPDALVGALGELAAAPEALVSYELAPALGQFLGAAYHLLDEQLRRGIEDTIVSMDIAGANGNLRDHLLSSLPAHALVTDAARELRATIDVDQARTGLDDDDFGIRSVPYDERTFMRENGVDVDSAESQRLDAALAPVKEFAEKHLNAVPSADEAHATTQALIELRQVLDELRRHSPES
jgi:hypothetical protein